MKHKILNLALMVLLPVLLGAGCEKEEKTSKSLIGSWKCLGFVNSPAGIYKEIEPKDCEKCYTLNLKHDGTVTGHTSTNEVMGVYEMNISLKQVSFNSFGGTEINELYDGRQYVEAILKVHSYEINGQGNLLLYYEDENNYLLFKSE